MGLNVKIVGSLLVVTIVAGVVLHRRRPVDRIKRIRITGRGIGHTDIGVCLESAMLSDCLAQALSRLLISRGHLGYFLIELCNE